MTCLPFMPLTGIYKAGKMVFEKLKDTPFGGNPTTHIVATAVATPVVMMPLMVPLGAHRHWSRLDDFCALRSSAVRKSGVSSAGGLQRNCVCGRSAARSERSFFACTVSRRKFYAYA